MTVVYDCVDIIYGLLMVIGVMIALTLFVDD